MSAFERTLRASRIVSYRIATRRQLSRGKCPVTSLASALDGRHGEYVSLWVCFGHSLAPRRVLGSYALLGVRAIKKQTTVPKRSKKLVCMAYSLVWLSISTFIYYSAADRGAEYCDERVCLSVSLSVRVCVCVCPPVRDHIFGTTRPVFTKFCACYLWQ